MNQGKGTMLRYLEVSKKNWGKCDTCGGELIVPSWKHCNKCDQGIYKIAREMGERRMNNSVKMKIIRSVLSLQRKERLPFQKACAKLNLNHEKVLKFKQDCGII